MNQAVATANEAKLSEYDFVVCIDTSGSMGDPVKAGQTRTRWEAVQESAISFARDLEKFDADGIDMVLFGGAQGVTSHQGVTAEKVREVFATRSPRGSTPLAEALTAALALAGKSDKKDFIIVFTDGVPDDRQAAARVIREASNKQLTDDALTILFVQIGDDVAASSYLKSLDDDLQGAKFDIVDAKTLAEAEQFATTAELVLAAIAD
jgi:Mg-chelatase subunit ChlD